MTSQTNEFSMHLLDHANVERDEALESNDTLRRENAKLLRRIEGLQHWILAMMEDPTPAGVCYCGAHTKAKTPTHSPSCPIFTVDGQFK